MFRVGAFLATLLIAGSALAHGFGGQTIPLPDNVVIFGEKSVQIAQNTNILGGDTASNKRAHIGRDSFIEGSILANRLTLQQDATIIGNAEADRIRNNGATIHGETITPRVTPKYELPTIPNSTPGTERIRVRKNETATLQPGAYGAVSIGRGANVTLEPGTYDMRRLHVGRNVILTITDTTTLNISNNLFIGAGTIINLAQNITVTDLAWNIRGHGTTFIGKDVFGAGVITSPRGKIHVSKETTWRGRLIGKRVRVGREAIISAGTAFNTPSSAENVIEDPAGGLIIVNEILVNLEEGVAVSILDSILNEVNGTIVGHIVITNEYKIRIEATTVQELNNAIIAIEALSIEGVEIVSKNGLIDFD